MIVEQSSSASGTSPGSGGFLDKPMGDLDDLNRTLYDIGAQDLLDVWEAMESEVSRFRFSNFVCLFIQKLDDQSRIRLAPMN